MKNKAIHILFWLMAGLGAHQMIAQVQDTSSVLIKIDHSDVGRGYNDDLGERKELVGKVELRHDSTYFYADSAHIQNNEIDAYGNITIQADDSTEIFSEELYYDGNTSLAELRKRVLLTSGNNILRTEQLFYDVEKHFAYYTQGALIQNDSMQITSRRGQYYTDIESSFFTDSVLVITDNMQIRTDSLYYNVKYDKITLYGPSLISMDTARVYAEGGRYNLATGKALFYGQAQYESDSARASADTISYNNNILDLIGNARYWENDRFASADTLRYLRDQSEIELIGNAHYHDREASADGTRLIFNEKTNAIQSFGRSTLFNNSTQITADTLLRDEITGIGYAVGDVIYRDTVEQITLIADRADFDETKDFVKAYGESRPVLITESEGDSIWIIADTLISIRTSLSTFNYVQTLSQDSLLSDSTTTDSLTLSQVDTSRANAEVVYDTLLINKSEVISDTTLVQNQVDTLVFDSTHQSIHFKDSLDQIEEIKFTTDTTRIILAYYDVKLYKSDLQATCDSLQYIEIDSAFYLFEDPLLWSDSTQFKAENITVGLKNNTVDQVKLRSNSFIMTSGDLILFDQIKGRDMDAFMVEGDLDRVHVQGNAESIYYALDEESAYIGVNQSVCSEIFAYFSKQRISYIDFNVKPTFVFKPINQVINSQPKLDGYGWYINRRPMAPRDFINQTNRSLSRFKTANKQVQESPVVESEQGADSDNMSIMDNVSQETPKLNPVPDQEKRIEEPKGSRE